MNTVILEQNNDGDVAVDVYQKLANDRILFICEEKTVKPVNAEVVNGFYSPLEKTINETKFDKLPAKQWIDKH